MIAGARFLHFAATLTVFGASLFFLYGLQWPYASHWPQRLIAVAVAAGAFSLALWIALLAQDLGGSLFDVGLYWTMLTQTGFGRALFFKIALTAASIFFLCFYWRMEPPRLYRMLVLPSALLTASFAGIGHGAAGEGSTAIWRMAVDILHLLCSGLWVGALVPLAVLMSKACGGGEKEAARAQFGLVKFSAIATGMLIFLIHTGIVNIWLILGGTPLSALFAAPYGLLLTAKLILFLAMLLLAAANRYWLTGALANAKDQNSRSRAARNLKRSIGAETALAFLVLLAVGFLGTMEPPGE